jgi:hypothetical protein
VSPGEIFEQRLPASASDIEPSLIAQKAPEADPL